MAQSSRAEEVESFVECLPAIIWLRGGFPRAYLAPSAEGSAKWREVSGGKDAWFWGSTAGAELDLLLMHRGRRRGLEFKAVDAPGMTKSLHIALEDLKLTDARIVYPGTQRYRVHSKVEVLPLADAIAEATAW